MYKNCRNRCKLIFIALLVLTSLIATGAEKNDSIQVLIVGTMHKLPGIFKGNYSFIRRSVDEFKPEIICSEFIPTDDSVSFVNFYGKSYTRAFDSTLIAMGINTSTTKLKIDSLTELLNKDNSIKLRLNLVQQYYFSKDFGNMWFQRYIILKKFKGTGLSEKELKNLKLAYHKIENNEYDLIVFPYCYQHKIGYIYPIDNHRYEPEYNQFTKKWKDECNGKLAKEQANYISKFRRKLFWSFLTGHGGEFFNSKSGQEFSNKVEAHFFKESVSQNYDKASVYWEKRNELMAKNVIRTVNLTNKKRIVVVVGASHVPFLKKYLSQQHRFKILTLSTD